MRAWNEDDDTLIDDGKTTRSLLLLQMYPCGRDDLLATTSTSCALFDFLSLCVFGFFSGTVDVDVPSRGLCTAAHCKGIYHRRLYRGDDECHR